MDHHDPPTSVPRTDSTSSASQPNTNVPTNPDWDRLVEEYDSEYAKELQLIKQWMPRLVHQLVHGCGNIECKASHCATGIRNTSDRPVRNYTPRSARVVALELLRRPHTETYLCDHSSGALEGAEPDEGPQDPSAFIQRLADSSCIKELAKGQDPLGISSCSDDTLRRRATAITRKLQTQCEPPFDSHGSPNPHFVKSQEVADTLAIALDLFYELLPEDSNQAHWHSLAHYINHGQALPSKILEHRDSNTKLVELLEIFELEHHVRLCAEVCRVFALRTQLEDVAAKFSDAGAGDDGILSLLINRVTNIAQVQTADKQDSWIPWPYPLWFKKAFVKHWDGKPVIQRGTVACGALELLGMQQMIWDRSNPEKTSDANLLPYAYKRANVTELMRSWIQHEPPVTTKSRHLLSFPFIYPNGHLVLYFRMLNHLRMREALKQSHVNEELYDRWVAPSDAASIEWDRNAHQMQHLRDFYLLVTVRREHVVQDAFDQIWQRRRSELLRPLRVRLGEMEGAEVGQDLGGVQIEFFNLVCKALFVEDTGMFTTDAITGLSYFRPGSLQPLYMFELFGLLVALAAYNGITIPVSFPIALYRHLLEWPCDELRDIQDGWPDIARSLQAIHEGGYEGLEYAFPLEANGLRLSIDRAGLHHIRQQTTTSTTSTLTMQMSEMSRIDMPASVSTSTDDSTPEPIQSWPGWTVLPPTTTTQPTTDLTYTNTPSYTHDYTAWLTSLSVYPQLNAFKKGFHSLLPPRTLCLFPPRTLKAAIEGTSTLDISLLRRAAQYEIYTRDEPYIQTFWRIIERWPAEKQKDLLRFVTAAERVPITGAATLTFKIQRADGVGFSAPSDGETLLPTSSTCFGTLYLPKYRSEEELERKLQIALEFGGLGFGTG
ncbi:hypothetical protein Q7P37_000748 [Cladosporium fusiforme]